MRIYCSPHERMMTQHTLCQSTYRTMTNTTWFIQRKSEYLRWIYEHTHMMKSSFQIYSYR